MKIEQIGKVTPEEMEILNILSEECAETIQCISKIFRFGWDSANPSNPGYTNKEHLTEEIGDLMCMINIISDKKNMSSEIIKASYKKEDKLRKYSNISF